MSILEWHVSTRVGLLGVVRRHVLRVSLSIVVALPLIVFGAWLLRYEISQQDVNPVAAYAVNWPLITVLAFLTNWFIWMDRKANVWQALKRWVVASLAHSCISYSLFAVMVEVFGWPAVQVSLSLTAALGVGSYILRSMWVFVQTRQEVVVAPGSDS